MCFKWWLYIGFIWTTLIMAAFGGEIINASYGIQRQIVYTVLKEKMSAFDAVEACKMRGYDRIADSYADGLQFVYIRHQLLQSGWPTTDFIWSDHVKLDTNSSWIDMYSCRAMKRSLVDPGPGKHCLLVDMTSDESAMNWIVANCSEKHYYACEIRLESLAYTVFQNTTSTGGESVESISVAVADESGCLSEISKFNTFLAIYSPDRKTCEVKRTKMQEAFYELYMEYSSEYNIVYVNNWLIPVSIVWPNDTVQISGERFACEDPQTSTEEVTTTSIIPTCECSPVCFPGNITVEQIEEIKENIRKTMTIEKKTLSSYTRQLVSASDDRTSSTTIGYVGAIIMAVCLSVIVLADAFSIFQIIMKKE